MKNKIIAEATLPSGAVPPYVFPIGMKIILQSGRKIELPLGISDVQMIKKIDLCDSLLSKMGALPKDTLILVLEDDQTFRNEIEKILRGVGQYTNIRIFNYTMEMIEAIKRGALIPTYDTLLITDNDLFLPVGVEAKSINGLELIQGIRKGSNW